MHFGYSRPHQSSNAPDQERGDAGRAASDAEIADLQNSTQRGSGAGAELPPQITEWMRRKKRKSRVDILRNSVSWAITLTVTGGIISVTAWMLPERSAVLELWHEQAHRTLEAMEQPKTIELTADEQITVPIPKAVSRRRWSNL